jgi:drug/metabolite transporter (DMT)-like permease
VTVILIALVSGLCLSLIGVAYNLGHPRGLQPQHIAPFMGFLGAAFFAALAGWTGLRAAPPLVWWAGVLAGLAQYVTVISFALALRRGPLSPVWCAASMSFLPALLYAWIGCGERPVPLRLAGAALACVCVVLASLLNARSAGAAQAGSQGWGTRLIYGVLLVLVLASAGSILVAFTYLGHHNGTDGLPLLRAHSLPVLCAAYLTFALALVVDLIAHPPPRVSRRALLPIGLLAAAGSVGGFALLRLVAHAPAACVFPINAVASLLGGSVSSVLVFRERISPLWIAMVLVGCVSVVLVGLA